MLPYSVFIPDRRSNVFDDATEEFGRKEVEHRERESGRKEEQSKDGRK